VLVRRDIARPGTRGGEDACATQVATRAARVRGGAVTLPLKRRGQSLERRSGTVSLVAGARTLARGRFALAGGAARTSAHVRLTVAGRRALAHHRRQAVQVLVDERVLSREGTLVLRR
jgi:hypothetical protein